ncbi:DUF4132 domain-containing protein [Actinomadura sp. WMMB 499]|uniref:DUF4132 domain-containing protein n=1 Tax=Actinomadura sp. WMMB 499 TaxID=1219491 RepID=UPI001244E6D5|nr:DUF4132 domain-containing protein [Actinomadura sp. WMMB 499]QFG20417.1 DUF4132 domain-containing protein [Actinomadura sp. WMMB 499]
MTPDEDVLTIPAAWVRVLHPRRGGTRVPPPRGNRAAEVPALLAKAGDRAARPALERTPDGELRDAVRRHLDGAPDPAGAAVVAHATVRGTTERVGGIGPPVDLVPRFVDHWRAEHGIGFAACALVELSLLRIVRAGLRRDPGDEGFGLVAPETARYVRRLLVAAPERDHDAALHRLADLRTDPKSRRLVSYLVPARQDWVDECLGEDGDDGRVPWWPLLYSLGNAPQLERLPPSALPAVPAEALLATLLDGLGAALLEPLLARLDACRAPDRRASLLEAVAALPTDEAFRALVERAGDGRVRSTLPAVAARFPVRAVRVLAADGGEHARDLLRRHLAAHPRLAPELPDELRPPAPASGAIPDADPADLPEPLCGLPWDRPVRPVVRGLAPPGTSEIVWRDGERARWAAAADDLEPWEGEPNWDELVDVLRAGGDPVLEGRVAVHGPDERVRPLLAAWEGPPAWLDDAWTRAIVARFELDAYPAVRRAAKRSSWAHAGLLLPFLDSAVAELMCGWLTRGKRAAPAAREWGDRHGLAAVPFLAPPALGKPGAARRNAEAMLRRIAARHGGDAVAAAVPAAAEELRTVLAAHPAATRLHRRPDLPVWADPDALPRVLLRGRERALPPVSMRALAETFALPGTPGADTVREACDPASLAAFGLAVFEGWRAAGMPAAGRWALAQLGRTGDDSTVAVLDPLIRKWTGRTRLPDAEEALGALARIGTDTALRAVHDLAVRWRTVGVRTAAAEAFGRAAAARGLPADVLGDRLVPDLGLGHGGATTVDYGRRRFTVAFDGEFRPLVTDGDGRLRKALPKPGRTDDPDRAPAAYKAFTDLRRDIENAVSLQTLRLERAMTDGRRWTPAQFRDHAVRDPLVRRIARRLVWIAHEEGAMAAFRIAEDGSLADAADEAFDPSGRARIGVAHPVLLGADLKAWAEVFADYEILQPFPQLGHPAFPLDGLERDACVLDRFAGAGTTEPEVQKLAARGWSRDRDPATGKIERLGLRTPGDRHIIVDTEAGAGNDLVVRRVRAVTGGGDGRLRGARPARFGELDPVAVSEALADLTALAGAGR